MSALDPVITVSNQRLATVDDLTAYLAVCLLTDARARPDDDVQDGSDLRGWWGDSLPDVPGDEIGSRLWTLKGKPLPDALERAPQLIREALQCGIDDGLFVSFEIRVEEVPPDRLHVWILPARNVGGPLEIRGPFQIAVG